jgi:hypothetical protein
MLSSKARLGKRKGRNQYSELGRIFLGILALYAPSATWNAVTVRMVRS